MSFRFASVLKHGSLLALSLALFGCGASTNGNAANEGGGGSGDPGGQGGDGGKDNGNQGGDGGLGITGMGDGGSTGAGFTECAKASEAATKLPLNMFIAIDKSGSMNEDNKWNNAKAAFTAFFQDPGNQAEQINVALRFWPDDDCNANSCNIDACAQPQAALGPLADPAHVQELVSLYDSKDPNGNTPMFPALGGAAQWAIANAQAGEGAQATVIVFVTDGEPNGCDENIDHIAEHAANAYAAANVPTFAVGMAGSAESDMQKIATAGNTVKPFLIGNAGAEQELAAALKAIQKATLACVFAMPEATGPDPIDPEQVNLTYTPTGAMPVTIGKVENEGACGAAGGWGWYYDNPEKPAVIQLCPDLCDKVQADEGGKIDIVLGCDTKPA